MNFVKFLCFVKSRQTTIFGSQITKLIVSNFCSAFWKKKFANNLFSDNKSATLAVVKTEISYVDLFTDREHVLFRSRCIGGKNDSAAQMFVYDLMKSGKLLFRHFWNLDSFIFQIGSHVCRMSRLLRYIFVSLFLWLHKFLAITWSFSKSLYSFNLFSWLDHSAYQILDRGTR